MPRPPIELTEPVRYGRGAFDRSRHHMYAMIAATLLAALLFLLLIGCGLY